MSTGGSSSGARGGLFLGVSLALHVGGFGAAYGGPAALQLLHDLRHPAQEKTATASLHGDTYRRYASRVGRFVPGLGRLELDAA